MRPITIAGLLLLVIATQAAAQNPPCTTTPVFTVTPGPPVSVTFRHATTFTFDIPQVTINGREITVRQVPLNVPPPPGTPSLLCNTRTVSLGTLAEGPYSVTWLYGVPPGVPGGSFIPFQTFTFAFSLGVAIPALGGPMLLGLMLVFAVVGALLLRR
jgi:hypothetical protein